MSSKTKYQSFPISLKVQILQEVEENETVKGSKGIIAKKYGISPSTLSTFIKNKDQILQNAAVASSSSKKRVRKPGIPEVDEAVSIWFADARNNKIQLDGIMIRTKAEEFAKKLGKLEFKASDGWLANWKKRNDVIYKTQHGESGSVNFEDAAQWMLSLDPILKEYENKNIFNADETGLYFKCEPERTFAYKDDPCLGGKRSKERVSVLVGANMVNFNFSIQFYPLN